MKEVVLIAHRIEGTDESIILYDEPIIDIDTRERMEALKIAEFIADKINKEWRE